MIQALNIFRPLVQIGLQHACNKQVQEPNSRIKRHVILYEPGHIYTNNAMMYICYIFNLTSDVFDMLRY